MADNRTGKITQVIGAVLDIKFGSDNLPEINDAIDIQTKDGGKLVVEVAQHLGDDTVRCIAMGTNRRISPWNGSTGYRRTDLRSCRRGNLRTNL